MAKQHYIIPIFVPHRGCPHACVFCNQAAITGAVPGVTGKDAEETIERYLRTIPAGSRIEVAFYGGSFTGIAREEQEELLRSAARALSAGRIGGIRLSTRPDYIDRATVQHLRRFGVDTVELGVQSLEPAVLAASRRGHGAEAVAAAVGLLREYGFAVGLQLMLGLPGDSEESLRRTVAKVIALRPDFVRLYPTLVLRDTALERLYREGKYRPLPLDEAVAQAAIALRELTKAGIPVIRLGLQATAEIAAGAEVVAGPFHPAFRQLVEGELMREALSTIIRRCPGAVYAFRVNPRDEGAARGQKNRNLTALRAAFAPAQITIEGDRRVPAGEIWLAGDGGTRTEPVFRVRDLL